MTGVQGADSILSGVPLTDSPRLAVAEDWDVQPKNYVLYAVKYISQYDSWYLRTGTDVYSDARGTVERKYDDIEKAQQVNTFSTLSKNSIVWNFDLKDEAGYARDCKLKFDFTESGAVSISSLSSDITASGSGQYTVLGEKNSWGGKDRDVMTLNYSLEWPEFVEVVENGPLTHWTGQSPATIDYVEVEYCASHYMVMTNAEAQSANWASQVYVTLPKPLEKDKEYTLTCKAKASSEYGCSVFLQSADGADQNFNPYITFGTDWSDLSTTFKADKDTYTKVTFNIGTFVGSIEIDDIVLTLKGSEENLIPNGNFEGYRIWRPAGSVQVTDKLVQWSRGVASEWFEVAAK